MEEEEENTMKRMTKYMFAIGAALADAFVLSACGGGRTERSAPRRGNR
jgi:hypothetical protein